mmetsp:Transcript_11549/g.24187  ORF Transcript_11549/g.24187 Transcript_11549/m.24187 type:complete len:327 (+) Transcript_11549:202-1182(+)
MAPPPLMSASGSCTLAAFNPPRTLFSSGVRIPGLASRLLPAVVACGCQETLRCERTDVSCCPGSSCASASSSTNICLAEKVLLSLLVLSRKGLVPQLMLLAALSMLLFLAMLSTLPRVPSASEVRLEDILLGDQGVAGDWGSPLIPVLSDMLDAEEVTESDRSYRRAIMLRPREGSALRLLSQLCRASSICSVRTLRTSGGSSGVALLSNIRSGIPNTGRCSDRIVSAKLPPTFLKAQLRHSRLASNDSLRTVLRGNMSTTITVRSSNSPCRIASWVKRAAAVFVSKLRTAVMLCSADLKPSQRPSEASTSRAPVSGGRSTWKSSG